MNITIRVSDELGAEIEKRRGDSSKADFYREMIEAYLRSDEGNVSAVSALEVKSEYVLRLETDLHAKDAEITFLRAKIDNLIQMLNQEQILHLQTQKLLPAPEPKKWWKFWKK